MPARAERAGQTGDGAGQGGSADGQSAALVPTYTAGGGGGGGTGAGAGDGIRWGRRRFRAEARARRPVPDSFKGFGELLIRGGPHGLGGANVCDVVGVRPLGGQSLIQVFVMIVQARPQAFVVLHADAALATDVSDAVGVGLIAELFRVLVRCALAGAETTPGRCLWGGLGGRVCLSVGDVRGL